MSLTYKGLIISVIGMILAHAGVNIADTDLTTTVSVIIEAIGASTIYWGRFRHGDINIFGNKV